MKIATCITATCLMLLCTFAQAQQLIVAYDFEGDTGFATDRSQNGASLDALLQSGASILPDAQRGGDVLATSSSGFGAFTQYDSKLEVTESFTLQAWVKTNSSGAFQHLVGRPGSGPRMFNHWGLGGLAAVQLGNPFDGFSPTDFGPGGGADGEWHHLLMTWNHVTRQLWGYFDGELGPSGNNGQTRMGTTVVTHEGPPGLIFSMGGNPLTGSDSLPSSLIDDVAFWEGFATQEVAQGLFNGTYSIYDAPIIDPSAAESPGDFNNDGLVSIADYTVWRDGLGANTALPNDDGLGTPITAAHYDLWKTNFSGAAAAVSASETMAVPTPSSCQFAVCSLVLLFGASWRRFTEPLVLARETIRH